MIKCPNCGQEQEESAKFCEKCGASLAGVQPDAQPPAEPEPETIFCPNCGAKSSADAAFCGKCGASLAPEAVQPTALLDVSGAAQSIPQPPKKQPPKKALLLIAAAAAVIAVVLGVSLLSGGGGRSGVHGMYLKDREISCTAFTKSGPMEVTSRLTNGEDMDNEELAETASELANLITFCKNGELLFYPDRVESDGASLYCRNLKRPSEEPVRIDSGVQSYAVNDAGTVVLYTKDGSVYRSDLTDKEKIASDVTRLWNAGDCQSAAYLDDEDSLYLWTSQGKEKIASDVEQVVHVSKDMSVFYYIKEEGLYRQAAGGEREKIAGDVSNVVRLYDSGEIYFVKAEDIVVDLMDYVRDDLAGDDAAMTEPQPPAYPSYPSRWSYSSEADYSAALAAYRAAAEKYDADYTAYQNAYQLYREKLSRDRLREELEEASMDRTQYTLCYYDGTDTTELTSDLTGAYNAAAAVDGAVVLVPVYGQEEAGRVKLSEIEDVYSLQSQVEEALYGATVYRLAKGGTLMELDLEDPQAMRLNRQGSRLAYLSDVDSEKNRGELFVLDLSGETPVEGEFYDSDVSTRNIGFLADGSLRYCKDVSESGYGYTGDLYIDKAQVDYDVYLSATRFEEDTGTLYYFTEWNDGKDYGTLNSYQRGASAKIADDVSDFCPLPDESVLYLYDYSTKSYRGTLSRFHGGESEKVDEDVTAILDVAGRTGGKAGVLYGW